MRNRERASLTLVCGLTGAVFGQALATISDVAPTDRALRIDGRDRPDDVIWDNGPWARNAAASQLAANYPFHAQTADDFDLPGAPGAVAHWSIREVAWYGHYWSPTGQAYFDMRVLFYADRGDKNAPTGGPVAI